jgi:murein L,D-transpeptidase YafK
VTIIGVANANLNNEKIENSNADQLKADSSNFEFNKQKYADEVLNHLVSKMENPATGLQSMFYVDIDKTSKVAQLKTWEENPKDSKVVYKFEVAFGKAQGDKVKEGDNKTPEGIYFSRRHIKRGLPKEKYGPYAIPLDFPNPVDLMQGKTGYGIWLHGAGNDERIKKVNVTEGCVAFYNKDILKIKNWVEPYQAAVVISKKDEKVNALEDVASVRKNFDNWLKAWSSRSFDNYISYYHEKFKSGRRRLASYSRYKNRVFRSYKSMSVNANEIKILTHPKYAVTAFNQEFRGGANYKSFGSKILYWQKEGENWKIVAEVFSEKEFKPMSFNRDSIVSLLGISETETNNVSSTSNSKNVENLEKSNF